MRVFALGKVVDEFVEPGCGPQGIGLAQGQNHVVTRFFNEILDLGAELLFLGHRAFHQDFVLLEGHGPIIDRLP